MVAPEIKLRRPPVIILGVDRSGTSLVGNIVHNWGAYGGDYTFLSEGDRGNPHGYWEYEGLGPFIRRFMKDVGVDFWHSSFVDIITKMAANPIYRDVGLSLISKMEREKGVWFWKEPALSFLLPFWKEIWGGATYIITVRNPYDSAVSWQKYSIPEWEEGNICIVAANLLRWQAIMLSILEYTQDCHSKHFIVYEELINNPREQCQRLADFLSIEYQGEKNGDGRLEAMAATVDPGLWRNHTSVPFDDLELATERQKALYKFLLEKAEDPNKPFDASLYTMYPGWREYLNNLNILRSLYLRLKNDRVMFIAQQQQRIVELEAEIAKLRQTPTT
jgi:hypothetical protein